MEGNSHTPHKRGILKASQPQIRCLACRLREILSSATATALVCLKDDPLDLTIFAYDTEMRQVSKASIACNTAQYLGDPSPASSASSFQIQTTEGMNCFADSIDMLQISNSSRNNSKAPLLGHLASLSFPSSPWKPFRAATHR